MLDASLRIKVGSLVDELPSRKGREGKTSHGRVSYQHKEHTDKRLVMRRHIKSSIRSPIPRAFESTRSVFLVHLKFLRDWERGSELFDILPFVP